MGGIGIGRVSAEVGVEFARGSVVAAGSASRGSGRVVDEEERLADPTALPRLDVDDGPGSGRSLSASSFTGEVGIDDILSPSVRATDAGVVQGDC